jgi:hypothetical protein
MQTATESSKTGIIVLNRYRCGYRGFLEVATEYIFFQFSRDRCRMLQRYAKTEFPDYSAFVNLMSKFMPAGRFLAAPLEIAELNERELARIFERIETGDVRLMDRFASQSELACRAQPR